MAVSEYSQGLIKAIELGIGHRKLDLCFSCIVVDVDDGSEYAAIVFGA